MAVAGYDDSYHLEISPARFQNSRDYQGRVDNFLESLFNIDDPDGSREAPLEYSSHKVLRNSTVPVSHVKFQLSRAGMRRGLTLDEAAEMFCRNMFDPHAQSIFGTLTTKSILGFAAISGVFRKHWIRSFLGDCFNRGTELLDRINTLMTDNSPFPDWAQFLSFATVSKLEVGRLLTTNESCSWPVAVVELGVTVANKYVDLQPQQGPAEHTANWKRSREDFNKRMSKVYGLIQQMTRAPDRRLAIGYHNGQEDRTIAPHENLFDALYEATLFAAKAFMANRELWKSFKEMRERYESAMITSGALAGRSLLRAGASYAAPRDSDSLYPWLAIGAHAISFAFYAYDCYDNYSKGCKAQKRMNYHEEMRNNILGGWGVANETMNILGWIRFTGGARINGIEFVDDDAEIAWNEFRARATNGARRLITQGAPTVDGPRSVQLYLEEQNLELGKIRERLAAGDPME